MGDAREPLLEPETNGAADGPCSVASRDSCDGHEVRQETGKILYLAVPLAIENSLWYASNIVTTIFIGHLGKFQLASVTLGESIFNITGFSLVLGITSGMDTLSPQAYGAQDYRLMGLILQRATLMCLCLSAIIIAGWTQLPRLLPLLGQDAAISAAAARYVLLSSPALVFLSISDTIRSHLTAQMDILPCTTLSIINTLLTPLFNWLLIYHWGLGLDGAAYASVVEASVYTVMLAAYFVWRERQSRKEDKHALRGWTLLVFAGWGRYLAIALPGLTMLCLEWWTFEVLVVLAGVLPDADLSVSTMGIAISISTMAYMLPAGLGGAVSQRVSTNTGSGQWRTARLAVQIAAVLNGLTVAATAAAVFAGRDVWPMIFTHDADVIGLAAHVLPILAFSTAVDGFVSIFRGVLTGLGRQLFGAAVALGAYWCCGLPLAVLLAFHLGYGIKGLWIALAVASSLVCIADLALLGRLDWRREAQKIRSSMETEGADGAVSSQERTALTGDNTCTSPLPA